MTAPSSLPKAVLYYHPASVCQEKGYGDDELDLRVVDISKGEEFSPTFLRLNPKATVPTLVVPLRGSLAHDVETRFKAVADPKALVDLLDKSRSATSRTNTTSSAPAPSLSPATVGFADTSSKIVNAVHSEVVAPETLHHLNARDPQSLQALAQTLLPVLQSRHQAILKHLSDCVNETIRMSNKTKAFWSEKKEATEILLQVLATGRGSHAEDYFVLAKKTWENAVPDVLTRVNNDIIGPYTLGDQISIADIHLCVWLVHVVRLSGGSSNDSGDVAIKKVEQYINTSFVLPQDFLSTPVPGLTKDQTMLRSRLAVFWDAMRGRPSWENVFTSGLV
ncbi:hypothetical protein PAXRUDRAFT_138839 [Paxillus rubicundulus Ve08.2h10]|uniref:GST N-terminal domain-containing protein n=1 Tax=Paxillus rubicundulus Ve08.2h10 TaxID=930991 RepID=A0A0D0DF55_9AGAM|nr:hypothetical protein PAXRUDRAFT_138839 [Paxillus rubicundulus Ve08.2h10]